MLKNKLSLWELPDIVRSIISEEVNVYLLRGSDPSVYAMPAQRVTMKDVAKVAGVSVATVSHVINKTRDVSTELQNRVHEAMETLGYRPDGLARSLKTGKTSTIGLLISDILNPFYPTIVRGIEDYLQTQQLSLILCNTDEDVRKQGLYLNVLLEQRVDGIICTPAIGTKREDLEIVDKMGIPVVLIDRFVPGMKKHVVLTDNYGAAYKGAHHLIKRGHKRIALVHGPLWVTTGEQRYNGCVDALKDHGLELEPKFAILSDFQASTTYSMTVNLFQSEDKNNRPTAIFSTNGPMTLGVLEALKKLNLRVGQDVALLSFDDSEWFNLVSPSITAISQPIYEMGWEAGKQLVKLLNREERVDTAIFPSKLVVRESTERVWGG